MTADKPRVGRKPLDSEAPSASVHLKLSARDFDSAQRLARTRGESIQDVIRRGLRRVLTDESANSGT